MHGGMDWTIGPALTLYLEFLVLPLGAYATVVALSNGQLTIPGWVQPFGFWLFLLFVVAWFRLIGETVRLP